MTEQSNALLFTMHSAAAATSALRSTYTGTFPGPTPIAGFPVACAARTIGVPPVARMSDVAWCRISSCDPGSVTSCMQETRPGGMPAPSPASAITRIASKVLRRADGCGAMTMPLRALTEMSALKTAVELGFVDGVSPTITPTGHPISTMRRCSSRRRTPTVGMSLIDSQTEREANSTLMRLCSAHAVAGLLVRQAPEPLGVAVDGVGHRLAHRVHLRLAWRWRRRAAPSRAASASRRASWTERRSSSNVSTTCHTSLGAAATSRTASRKAWQAATTALWSPTR